MCVEMFGPAARDALPMWVADEDFGTPSFAVEAIKRRCEKPVFGYTVRDDAYKSAIVDWMKDRFDWIVDGDALCFASGCVPALSLCIVAYSNVGDGIVIMPPVYYPFAAAVSNNNRTLIEVPLKSDYAMDFDSLREAFEGERPRMLIFCSPHNPTGRVWTEDELRRLLSLCLEFNVVLIADEIWCNLVLPSYNVDASVPFSSANARTGRVGSRVFVPMACVDGGKFSDIVVHLSSMSKAFNVAAIQDATVIISNRVLRQRYVHACEKAGIFGASVFAPAVLRACYSREGARWLDASLLYIADNVRLTRRVLAVGYAQRDDDGARECYPYGMRANVVEATYLVWIDCTQLVRIE
jgi:cystathionine beta-lyase